MDLTSELNTTKNQMPHQYLKSSFKKNYNVFILFKFVFIYIFAKCLHRLYNIKKKLFIQLQIVVLCYGSVIIIIIIIIIIVCGHNDLCTLTFVPDVQYF